MQTFNLKLNYKLFSKTEFRFHLREWRLLFFAAGGRRRLGVDEAAQEEGVLRHSLVFAPTANIHLQLGQKQQF